MDLATVIGIVLSFGLVVGAIVTSGSLLTFIDIPSVLIVGGGTLGTILVNYPLKEILSVIGVAKNAFFAKSESPTEVISRFMEYANRARREGILSLEPIIKEIDDVFLRKGLQLTVDGLEPQAIQEILETEISYLEDRHENGAEILSAFGTFAPAMGMIGTVIGLIMMLQNMSDPSTIGPSMAVALITTFYGAVLSNLIFLPMAGKLKLRSKQEVLIRAMVMEGILAISKGENPRIIEEKLTSYIAPKQRPQPS
ncbi:motility protein A [Megalodesulfovibrio gigas]|uniref:Putative MotA/TolQ/ExbB proton channel n=1 Tax=Megalodesulfovibrio gigas (strain ATCC 19364 / DSM 1382 / NCIMB 9332 / VKM B-1759) TaxID=1121448 RepID=T2G9C2_MEGG1|nr:MotA/TolQ/ExbB proton channel family protein [Megalodesulfovibrio gigas]AGW12774.1 putative MotA/TolQ/ExbB proton channel [Megalodesulfovibrio gigas DSM 1382 = ATCC 19364]